MKIDMAAKMKLTNTVPGVRRRVYVLGIVGVVRIATCKTSDIQLPHGDTLIRLTFQLLSLEGPIHRCDLSHFDFKPSVKRG